MLEALEAREMGPAELEKEDLLESSPLLLSKGEEEEDEVAGETSKLPKLELNEAEPELLRDCLSSWLLRLLLERLLWSEAAVA